MHNKTEGGSGLLVLILTFGVFSILNTEMGVIGMLPLIADTFQVSVPQAGWTVTVFALVIAVCGPITPMLFSRFDQKTVMLSALGVFIISNAVSMFTESFAVLLVSRLSRQYSTRSMFRWPLLSPPRRLPKKTRPKRSQRFSSEFPPGWCWEFPPPALLPAKRPTLWQCFSLPP